jgi:hypothetical protein
MATPLSTTPLARDSSEKIPKPRHSYLNDSLGKHVAAAVRLMHLSSSWESFVQAYRGPSLLSTAVKYLPHPAAPLLDNIRSEGVPVTMSGDEWSAEKIQEMARRGPHKSAKDHALFIRDEMASFAEQGFWVVLPLPEVEDMDRLRLSPLGVVPQRDRRPRLINDLTFSGVNAETVQTGLANAMQFGHTLLRLLYQIRHANPAFGPVYAMKIDVADGFYRVNLDERQALSLACLLPQEPGEPQLVAVPLALPMGWVESPPYFCAATKTIADLVNSRLSRTQVPRHRLEHEALRFDSALSVPAHPVAPAPFRPSQRMRTTPVGSVDVFVDDFLGLAQGTADRPRHITRVLLHTIDEVLQPADPTRPSQKEPASVKILQHPPLHRVLSELHSMALAVPVAHGLFSELQTALQQRKAKHHIRITCLIRQQLTDFAALADNLHNRPTRVEEIIADEPSVESAWEVFGSYWEPDRWYGVAILIHRFKPSHFQ